MSSPRFVPPFQAVAPVRTVALRWQEHEEGRCEPGCWWCTPHPEVNVYCEGYHDGPTDFSTSRTAMRTGH